MTPIELINLDDLILAESNPRTISKDEMDRLCKSMTEDPDFIKCRPILVHYIEKDMSMNVYAGSQRVRAAKILGWKEIPCIVQANLSDKIIKQRLIKDNMHAGDWDYDILGNEFEMDMLLDVGFNPSDFDIGIDLGSTEELEKKKKEKLCPNCGHEL